MNLIEKHSVWVWISMAMGQCLSHGVFPFASALLTAFQIVKLKTNQAMDHTPQDPFSLRQLLSLSTGLLPGSFLPSRVSCLPWKYLAGNQKLWWEVLSVEIQLFFLIAASTDISYCSTLVGKLWPNVKETAQEQADTSV